MLTAPRPVRGATSRTPTAQNPPVRAQTGAWTRTTSRVDPSWGCDIAIVGSPDTVAGRIAALHDELGFGNLTLVTGFLGNLPQEHVVTTLELFAQEVMPRFQPAPVPVESR